MKTTNKILLTASLIACSFTAYAQDDSCDSTCVFDTQSNSFNIQLQDHANNIVKQYPGIAYTPPGELDEMKDYIDRQDDKTIEIISRTMNEQFGRGQWCGLVEVRRADYGYTVNTTYNKIVDCPGLIPARTGKSYTCAPGYHYLTAAGRTTTADNENQTKYTTSFMTCIKL